MSDRWRVDREVVLDEVLHGDQVAAIRRESRVLVGDGPPLAVERTCAVGGTPRAVIVLVHGFAQNRFTWRVQGRSLVARLAVDGFDVWNLELRGHGASREAGAPSATAFADYVEDLVRVARAAPAPPWVIGHSLGAGVGIGAATTTPLAGLIHLAGVWQFAAHNPTLRALAAASLAAERPLTALGARFSTAWAGRALGRLYGVTEIAGFGFPISGWTPDAIERPLLEERLALGFDWTSVAVWLEMARWASGAPFPYAEAFGRLDLPLLVVAGDHDPLVTPRDARACYEASASRDKSLRVFDRFEHDVHWGHVDLILGRRAPDHVWPCITAWLAERVP